MVNEGSKQIILNISTFQELDGTFSLGLLFINLIESGGTHFCRENLALFGFIEAVYVFCGLPKFRGYVNRVGT